MRRDELTWNEMDMCMCFSTFYETGLLSMPRIKMMRACLLAGIPTRLGEYGNGYENDNEIMKARWNARCDCAVPPLFLMALRGVMLCCVESEGKRKQAKAVSVSVSVSFVSVLLRALHRYTNGDFEEMHI